MCMGVNTHVYILVYICPVFIKNPLYIGLNVGFSYFTLRGYGSNFAFVNLCTSDTLDCITEKLCRVAVHAHYIKGVFDQNLCRCVI